VQKEDFRVQVRDEQRVLVVPAEMLSKLDLQVSAGISSTRTFLLRSLAFFGHGGHSASPCGPVRRVTSTRRGFLSMVLRMRVTVCFSDLGR
jgi:hypothetical protein